MIFKLIYNFSLLIALSVLSGVIDQFAHRRSLLGKILQGILFGGTALIGMLYPFQLAEGLIFDGRSIVISLATLFFGPVTGFISASFALIYRLYVGGAGVYMGVSVILSSFFIGWIFHHLRQIKKISLLRYRHLLLFGLVVHSVMILLISLLPSGPRVETLRQLGLVILLAYPFITLIMGIILNDQEQNRNLLLELTKSEKYLNTIFRSIGDALISLNEHGRIVALNHAAEELLCINQNDAKGQHIDQLISLNSNYHSISENFPRETEYMAFQPVDVKFHRGGIIRVSGTISTIKDEENKHRGWVLSLRDFRREQEYETRLQTWGESYKGLFNSILSSVYIQNEKGEFLDVNQAAVKLYGYPYEKFIGNTPEFLSAPGMNKPDELAHNTKKAFNGESVQFEFWGRKASGEIFPKEVFLFPTQYFGQKAIVAIANDISQRKESEKTLRLSEARYKYLFESSPMGMILEDLSGTIISANSAFCHEYGYEPIELIGKNIRLLANPDNKALVKHNIDKIIQTGYLKSQIKATTKYGQEIDIELIESLIDLPDGRKGILSISKNITAQVAAEKSRRESEQKNQAILQSIPDLIFVLTFDGIFVEYRAAKTGQLLLPPEHFLNEHVDAVLPPFLAKTTLEKLRLLKQNNTIIQEYEYELVIKGEKNFFEARMVSVDENHALTIVRDVTAKKLAEQQLRHQSAFIQTLLDSVPNPLFYMDINSAYLGVNEAFIEFFGINRDEIVGKTMFDWDEASVAFRNHQDDQLIFDGKEKLQQRERSIVLRDGSERSVIVSKSAFHTPEGEVAGLIGLIIDITERKKNELELLLAKEKAEESDRLKTSFLHNMNHEIRTPLNAILGFSDLLFEDIAEDQKREFVGIINSNAEQLLRIIDDVLIVSRLDAERMGTDKIRFSLNQLINDLMLTFSNACKDKNLEISLSNKGEDDLEIFTDRAKVRQVLSGLLENAVKYTMNGGISIGYTIKDQTLKIHVTDTGIGIDPGDINRIFERFFRGEKPQRLAIRGNGLGLSIAIGLAKLLNGDIEVISEPGLGSTFTLVLSDVIENSSSHNQSFDNQTHGSSRPLAFNILIAEDEDDNFEYLRAISASYATIIDRARNGSEALGMMENHSYDLVLMDIKMPVMDGFQATKLIRQKFPSIPIIVQTAYSQPQEVRQAIEAGASDVLIKPINKEVYHQVIQRLLGL